MKFSPLSRKWVTVLLHIAFWMLLFSLPFLLRPAHENNTPRDAALTRSFFQQYLINFFSWIGLFYFNGYFLIPRLLNTKRYVGYGLSLLPVLAILLFINWVSFVLLIPKDYSFPGAISFFLLPCIFILSCSTAITMLQNKLQSDQLAQKRETENLKTELAFLRSQVSPHFMFNVLNNMVALARKKSDLLEPSLFKLSTLMRYMLYETDEDKVLLEREVEYLQSYIDLQLQRFGSKLDVHLSVDDIDKGYLIEPMLLIPFVENAFKHGTGFKQKGNINIELRARNKMLEFKVSNYYDSTVQQVKDKTSGIGLQNVKRRLDLLYRHHHSLLIKNDDNRFSVTLTLHLHR